MEVDWQRTKCALKCTTTLVVSISVDSGCLFLHLAFHKLTAMQLEMHCMQAAACGMDCMHASNRLSIIANEIASLDHGKVGIYRLQMKSGSDNLRESASIKLVSKLLSIGLKPSIFEPNLEVPKIYAKYHTVDFEKFANNCDIIVANRWDEKIEKYKHKLFCRDVSNVD